MTTWPAALALSTGTLCLFVGVLTLRYSRAPGWREQRWLALGSAGASLYILGDVPITLPGFSPLARCEIASIQMVGGGVNVLAWLALSRHHLGLTSRRRDRFIEVPIAVLTAAGVIPGVIYQTELLPPLNIPWLGATYWFSTPTFAGGLLFLLDCVGIAWVGARYARGFFRGVPDRGWEALGLFVLLLGAISDSLVSSGLIRVPLALDVGYLAPVAALALSQTSRFVRNASRLEELSTRLEQLVEERTRALVEAQRSLHRSERLAAIGQLAAGVAHEVNNPAAAVKANLHYLAESIRGGALPEDGRECIQESLASINRITEIVKQLKASSRAAADDGQNVPVPLAAAARAAVRSIKDLPPGTRLEVDIESRLQVLGQEPFLVQVLTNLITNALHAAKPGEPPWVALRAEVSSESVMLTVEDHGCGMSRETQSRLFEPFFTTKPVGQGTGLGLAVCLGLLQGMGGTIAVESELGHGTRVRLQLQRGPSEDVQATDDLGLAVKLRRRLLLVDDDPHVRAALGRDLGSLFEVEVVSGVGEALARSESLPAPDIILCDVVMAEGGGAQLYEALLRNKPGLASRVIFITGGATSEALGQFLTSQRQPVIYKPLDLPAFLEVAERLCA